MTEETQLLTAYTIVRVGRIRADRWRLNNFLSTFYQNKLKVAVCGLESLSIQATFEVTVEVGTFPKNLHDNS